jgi:hypothetical protein
MPQPTSYRDASQYIAVASPASAFVFSSAGVVSGGVSADAHGVDAQTSSAAQTKAAVA